MSYRGCKKAPYNPYVMYDNSFDVETALRHAPNIMETILQNNFSKYSPREFSAIRHHAVTFAAHALTDKLCEMYPEESFHKLSKWADWFSYRYIKTNYNRRYTKPILDSSIYSHND